MTKISISIDVSNLDKAEAFYTEALGCKKLRYVEPNMLVVAAGSVEIYIQEKKEGSKPVPSKKITRNYKRHWTPVHLDFYFNDIEKIIPKILELGGNHEGGLTEDWGSIAFCSDPFGNGFCLIEENKH